MAQTWSLSVLGWVPEILTMLGAGILDGDFVVVDRSVAAQSGHVVVAVLGGEMTLKRFRRTRSGRAALQAENPDFPEFVIGEEAGPAEIWGVVVALAAARVFRWSVPTTLLALAASIPPAATIWFERRAVRRGELGRLGDQRTGSSRA